MSKVSLKIEFGGGLELLFSNQRSHRISIPSEVPKDNSTDTESLSTKELKPVNAEYLVYHMRDHLLKERPELFIENGTVRPGILVLINDTDWELEGEGDYKLKDGDEIVWVYGRVEGEGVRGTTISFQQTITMYTTSTTIFSIVAARLGSPEYLLFPYIEYLNLVWNIDMCTHRDLFEITTHRKLITKCFIPALPKTILFILEFQPPTEA
ncbi:hypothetical protein NLJ89_g9716 [Agrocybe chaxingu]|uniref:Ubiquitin-related modifier 1 n=1 Tax=Agrocybe chaxingu TaxID=84603 RepID=A0A9W8MQY5_9AGAR|nr:hypothetical protein NLJ89_g9716 [Agrocybe chaxingu]